MGFPADLAEEICARIEAANLPALIVGGDVERYGAWDAVIGLAERTQSVVWTAPLTGWSGFPENHPLYQGMLPPGAGWVSQALTGRDLVVVIGAPVFRYYPRVPGPYLPPGTSLIHITNDPDEAARAPVGDADHRRRALRRSGPARCGRTNPATRSSAARPIPKVEHAETPLKRETLWAAVGHAAPPDTLWVSEAGSNEFPITTGIRPGNPVSHLSAAGGGLGFGLPAAVGAQLATPDRPVVALMGDGPMHYAITAFWTASHYRIPVTIVVASNAEYGVLKEFGKWEKTAGVPGLDLPGLDVVGTAASYGVDAHEAHTADEVIKLVKSGIADRKRPTLINARTMPVTPKSLAPCRATRMVAQRSTLY